MSEREKRTPADPAEERERKKQRKAAKKAKHKKVRHIVLLCILAFLLIGIGVGYAKIHPLYVEAQDKIYDILADMNEGTFRRASNTVVNDKDGNLVGKIGYEKYKYVDISDISDYIQDGYIAVEDKNFKTHHGIDLMGTARAAFKLVVNRGKITQGGSTITMQVIKNNLLSQKRTFSRKAMEMLLALQLEKQYTKAEIMEFYCNSNYYGNSCYGVEGASQYYFGKSADQIDLAEAAILVGTSNSPNNYNPAADYEAAMSKKKQVLGQMLSEEYITQEQYDQAVQERPTIVKKTDNVGSENYITTYAVHCAALKLMEHNGFQFQYTFDSQDAYDAYQTSYNDAYNSAADTIRAGGYTIDTSIDPSIQDKLQAAVDDTLAGEQLTQDDGRYDMQGASICIDNSTGLAVAVVGGRGTNDSYNRAFQAERQPGSSIKPLLVYGAGLNEGYISPGTIYNDHQVDYNGYSPKNAGGGYHGEVPIREALARSLNTVAVQVLYNTGHEKCLSYLGALKFRTLSFADSNNLAIALGGFTNGVTVEDMVRGYATIANQGQMRDNSCITSLESEVDGLIYKYDKDADETEVYTKDTAFMLSDMMQGTFVEDYGTAHKFYNDSQYFAGKTGTTNANRDAWFAGFSEYYTTVTWTGNDSNKSNDNLKGSGYPAQIWSTFMNSLHEGKEKKDFPMPSTILLKNSSGTEKKPDYTTNIYKSRPSGWDYTSGELEQKLAENERLARIEDEKEDAEKAVSKFEDFQIESADEARSLDDKYNDVLSVIGKIENDSEQAPYKERAAYKYNLLNGDVKDKWEEAIAELEKKEQEEKNIANQKAAQQSLEDAEASIKTARTKTVQEYIDALNGMTVYSSAIDTLIADAESALQNCSSYSNYSSLQSSLNSAITRAKALPTAEEVRQQQEEAQKAAEEAAKKAAEAQQQNAQNQQQATVTPSAGQ